MCQGAVLQIGVDLLDHRMSPMGLVGGDGVEITGGEERVEAVGVEQCRLINVLGNQLGNAAPGAITEAAGVSACIEAATLRMMSSKEVTGLNPTNE